MSVSYDIFDLADFPIIVTNENFVIKHKNNVAAQFFPNFRKGSKIIRHTSGISKNTDFSSLCEIDFQTGTQLKRALVFSHYSGDVFFVFLSRLQLEDGEKLARRIKEAYSGNFWDFYIAAYNEYEQTQNRNVFSQNSHAPARLCGDFMLLLKTSFDKPAFMKKEVYDVAELISLISLRVGPSLRALGLKMPMAQISPEAKKFCFCKINLCDFSFIVFRMIYAGFKLSRNGCVNMSLDYLENDTARVSVFTNTTLPDGVFTKDDFSDFVGTMSELSFEFELLRKMELLNTAVTCKIENSVLHIYFTVKCISGLEPFPLRSNPLGIRDERIARNISENISKLKKLLSK